MKTAVEFLVEQLADNGILHSSDIAKAKEMEKQQIIEANKRGIELGWLDAVNEFKNNK